MSQLVKRSELRRVFNIVMAYFCHDPDQERAAWEAARCDEYTAYRCYAAIVRSLEDANAAAR